jgi:hypothetical protein
LIHANVKRNGLYVLMKIHLNGKKLKMKWISVKDRLPEENKEVLFYVFGEIIHGKLNKQYGIINLDFGKIKASYWMPLPEAPEKE